jgi:APA family basic amino acid/polyamine antiporter
MSGLPLFTWVVTGGWFLLGMLIYFGYGIWNSKLNAEVDDSLEVELLS